MLLSDQHVANLGKYIDRDVKLLEDQGWEEFIRSRRGKSDISPKADNLNHPARSNLRHLRRRGARVPMSTAPWTEERLSHTMERGPHKSAFKFADFLGEELVEFVLKGQWIVLPYKVVQRLPARIRRQLRISPMGVVPQRDRRPRVIVDYSYFGVNDETTKLAPREAMQFGKALERILRQIVEADPAHGPIYLLKIDISDGFYRIWLNESDIPTLAVSLPPLVGSDTPLLALPLVLPMGWTESPPYFTVATETVADLANRRMQNSWRAPPHRLDAQANSKPTKNLVASGQGDSAASAPLPTTIPRRRHHRKPLGAVDVFVDDFVGMVQGSEERRENIRRIILHTLDEVFRPLEPGDNPHRKEPASDKKLLQGDGYWEVRKLVLGWILDTLAMTIELPAHRRDRLRVLLEEIPPTQKRLSVKKWQQILGELRSMSIAIPGSRGLFSLLQETLKHRADGRIRLSRGVHDTLDDFRWLDRDLTSRPTRLFEIVPQDTPEILSATDACGYGLGGVAFPLDTTQRRESIPGDGEFDSGLSSSPLGPGSASPIVWQYALPPEITSRLVSFKNPKGDITNSDLELLATVIHKDVLAQAFDIRERTLATGTDNTPALAWQGKGSTSTTGPAAYLLRAQALHQRFHRYRDEHFYIPGPVNVMADDASQCTLALADAPERDAFMRDLCAAQLESRHGVVPTRAAAIDSTWEIWRVFCQDLYIDPTLQDGVQDPIHVLQVFAHRYRHGIINPSKRRVASRTVESALRAVGQTIAGLGAADPRLAPSGKHEFRLSRQLQAYKRLDPPPTRVKPIPVPVLQHVTGLAHAAPTAQSLAIANMILIAFFFLMRPGEYTVASDDTAFRLQDVEFHVGLHRWNAATIPLHLLDMAHFVTMTFTTQKNGDAGAAIGLGRSSFGAFCPVQSCIERVRHLRIHNANPTDPLCTYFKPDGTTATVTAEDITTTVRFSLSHFGDSLGIRPTEISARSLRASGAMALLCSHVDSDTIRLLGRWRSDAMLRYLHVQAVPVMHDFARRMVVGGNYTMVPGAGY